MRALKKGKIIISSFLLASMMFPMIQVNTFAEFVLPENVLPLIALPENVLHVIALPENAVQMFGEKDFEIANKNAISVPNRRTNALQPRSLSRVWDKMRPSPENLKLKSIFRFVNSMRYLLDILPDLWNTFGSKKSIDLSKFINDLEQSLTQVVGQEEQKKKMISSIVGVLGARDFMDKDKKAHVIYMAGPSGVGKTYAAEILARSLNGNKKPFVISPANIDFNKKITVEQLFGIQTNMMDFFTTGKHEDSLIDYVERTEHPVIIINEYDKMFQPALDEIFRTIVDDGQITISGKKMNFSGTTFIITSNESHCSLANCNSEELDNDDTGSRTKIAHDKSFMNRVQVIEFDNLAFEDYKKIAENNFTKIADRFKDKYGIEVNFHRDMFDNVAKKAGQLNRGSRPIVNDLRNTLITLLTQKRLEGAKKDKGVHKSFHVSYNLENDEIKVYEVDDKGNEIENKTKALTVSFIEDANTSNNNDNNLAEDKGMLFEDFDYIDLNFLSD